MMPYLEQFGADLPSSGQELPFKRYFTISREEGARAPEREHHHDRRVVKIADRYAVIGTERCKNAEFSSVPEAHNLPSRRRGAPNAAPNDF